MERKSHTQSLQITTSYGFIVSHPVGMIKFHLDLFHLEKFSIEFFCGGFLVALSWLTRARFARLELVKNKGFYRKLWRLNLNFSGFMFLEWLVLDNIKGKVVWALSWPAWVQGSYYIFCKNHPDNKRSFLLDWLKCKVSCGHQAAINIKNDTTV